MAGTVRITGDLFETLDADLSKIDLMSKSKAVTSGMRKALNVPKRRLKGDLPKPGYPGDKPGLKPLRETPSVSVKHYGSGVVLGVLGYAQPTGAHGMLLELGHRIVTGGTSSNPIRRKSVRVAKDRSKTGKGTQHGFVEGRFYLEKAASATESQQFAILETTIKGAMPNG